MENHPVVLADPQRVEVFLSIWELKAQLQTVAVSRDSDGVPWKIVRRGETAIGIAPLGYSSIWQKDWSEQSRDQFKQRLTAVRELNEKKLEAAFTRLLQGLRLGQISERILWHIHREVLASGASLVTIPDVLLRKTIWGEAALFM